MEIGKEATVAFLVEVRSDESTTAMRSSPVGVTASSWEIFLGAVILGGDYARSPFGRYEFRLLEKYFRAVLVEKVRSVFVEKVRGFARCAPGGTDGRSRSPNWHSNAGNGIAVSRSVRIGKPRSDACASIGAICVRLLRERGMRGRGFPYREVTCGFYLDVGVLRVLSGTGADLFAFKTSFFLETGFLKRLLGMFLTFIQSVSQMNFLKESKSPEIGINLLPLESHETFIQN